MMKSNTHGKRRIFDKEPAIAVPEQFYWAKVQGEPYHVGCAGDNHIRPMAYAGWNPVEATINAVSSAFAIPLPACVKVKYDRKNRTIAAVGYEIDGRTRFGKATDISPFVAVRDAYIDAFRRSPIGKTDDSSPIAIDHNLHDINSGGNYGVASLQEHYIQAENLLMMTVGCVFRIGDKAIRAVSTGDSALEAAVGVFNEATGNRQPVNYRLKFINGYDTQANVWIPDGKSKRIGYAISPDPVEALLDGMLRAKYASEIIRP